MGERQDRMAVGSNRLATLDFLSIGMGDLQPGNRVGTRSCRHSAGLGALRDNDSAWQKILQQRMFQGISQFKSIKP